MKQCFNCFKYDHKEPICKIKKRCIISSMGKHNIYYKLERCINYKEGHRSTLKECRICKFNRTVKRIMTKKNINIKSCKKNEQKEKK